MSIKLPEVSLVVLIGPSGSGKSSFARRHFKPTEVIASDVCRGLVSDDENDQSATNAAFEVLHFLAAKRLANQKLTVIDATNVQPEGRKSLVALARAHHCLPVAIVLNVAAKVCEERNRTRPDRQFGAHVVRQQAQQLRKSIRGLSREGFRHIAVLSTPDEVEAATVERVRLWTNRRDDHGPFDIIGDVHGCREELVQLLTALGYTVTGSTAAPAVAPPTSRRALFLGDLVDRGPDSPGVLRLVMAMVERGQALCIPGNHESKLLKKLRGRDVQLTHGLAETMMQLEREPPEFHQRVAEFIDSLVSHYVLDDGKLVVAHAGMKEELQGRASGTVRQFAYYGETTGETDEFGLPVRYDWAADYRGQAQVVYGHTPVPDVEWVNRTLCIDTGCVFGGKLTALRYPEKEIVEVAATAVHYAPAKPFPPRDTVTSGTRKYADLLDIEDVRGKRIVSTRLHRTVTVREENAVAALEVMSRFAVDPRWLIYLPPTMSPSETAESGDYLEHPSQAFAFYRAQGVPRVVCEEKHMGSRAVVVLCRDEASARRRFGTEESVRGVVYTRTGRRFFADPALEARLLERLADAFMKSGFWERFATSWVCLDTELMPWSAKAIELLRTQYAAVGSAARRGLGDAVAALAETSARTPTAQALLERFRLREAAAHDFVAAYRRYCWPVTGIEGLVLAPFQLLATEGKVHTDRDHVWHMEQLASLCIHDPELLRATPYRLVDLADATTETAAVDWWLDLTARGGEGMVVKPLDAIAHGQRGLIQPAIKCRGREYLRIIYGPEYTLPEHLERLRSRGLAAKRSLALREFALGLEALHRFVEQEPLYRVHECVFGVLALESEPVDPRL